MGRTWEEVGADLGLSRTMLHYVRRGERTLSAKAMVRLRDLEADYGLTPPVTRIDLPAAETRDEITAKIKHALAELEGASPGARELLTTLIEQLAAKLAGIVRRENRQVQRQRRKQNLGQ